MTGSLPHPKRSHSRGTGDAQATSTNVRNGPLGCSCFPPRSHTASEPPMDPPPNPPGLHHGPSEERWRVYERSLISMQLKCSQAATIN